MTGDPSTRPPNILLVSNGFGEAAIATYIARAIVDRCAASRVEHFALVGAIAADARPTPVGPQQAMPSGGLVTYGNVKNLARDVRAGLGRLTLQQCRFLATQRERDALIAVGDIYCLAMCLLFARRPAIFVATAKSNLVAPHSALEYAVARRAAVAFARDAQTASALRAAGVPAQYAGNVMMDGLTRTNVDLRAADDALHIGALPGSRADAATNAGEMTARLVAIAALLSERGRGVQAFFSLAPSVDARAVNTAISRAGIPMSELRDGIGVVAEGESKTLRVALVRGAFADLLAVSDIVLGQAGTANEQAAGLGRPVVAAAEHGEAPDKMHWYRMRQKRLLGDALLVLPADPHGFATQVVQLLDDPLRMRAMAQIGRDRMGQAGGAAAVAAAALSLAAQEAA